MTLQPIETTETITVPEAGRRYYGIGKVSSYKAAKAGLIPTIRVGHLLRVPVRLMEKKMETPDTVES